MASAYGSRRRPAIRRCRQHLHPARDAGREAGRGEVYSVIELDFEGPYQRPADAPAREITFWGRFRHESGNPTYQVHSFWDGDGQDVQAPIYS